MNNVKNTIESKITNIYVIDIDINQKADYKILDNIDEYCFQIETNNNDNIKDIGVFYGNPACPPYIRIETYDKNALIDTVIKINNKFSDYINI